jgi:hypothetical protein
MQNRHTLQDKTVEDTVRAYVSIWECGNALTNQEVTLKQVLTTNASTSV